MWVFAVWLYLNFLSNPAVYQQMKDNGATAYVYLPSNGEKPTTPPPPNFYDPKGQ